MKVLITGGTGFVGSHVCRQLLSRGLEVRLLVRDKDKANAIYRGCEEGVPELLVGDVTDRVSVRQALDNCDGVVHAAAATPMQIASIEQLFAVNVDGVKNVFDEALAKGIDRLVSISSITAIFDEDASKVTADATPVLSKLPYGQSKGEAENYLRGLQETGAPISIVYPGGVIGPDDPGFSDAFKALKHRIENGFRIFGDGGIQHIDVRDLAALICSLVSDGGCGRFLMPGVYCRWDQLADIIEDVSGCQLERIRAQGWKLRLFGRLIDVLRLVRKVDSPISAETMRYATLWPNIQNTDELDKRGISLRNLNETFADAISWMIKAGYLEASLCPKLSS